MAVNVGGLMPMLVLTRKPNQSIMIGDDIEVTVLEVRGEQVRIGVSAPKKIPVHRKEIYEEIQQQRAEQAAQENQNAESPSQDDVPHSPTPSGEETA